MNYVLGILIFVVIAGIGSAADIGTGTMTFIGVFAWILFVTFSDKKDKDKLKELNKKTSHALKFDPETGVITLTERNQTYAKMFDFERYVSKRHSYSQEKLIFTSATVGGVTTGGVDKVGGYDTEQKKTDRYNLVYKYVDPKDNSSKKGIVKEIELSDDLLEEAIHSEVKVYLNGNRIVVVTPLVSSDKEKQGIVNMYRVCSGKEDEYVAAMANVEENDKIRTMPTLKKSSTILKWISNLE